MFEDAELWFDDKDATIASTATTTDGDHGRIEVRTCRVTMDIAWFQAMHAWPELACIAEVVNQTTVKRTGKTTLEKRLFLCSRCAPAALLLEASRLHWHVENKVHYVLGHFIRRGFLPGPQRPHASQPCCSSAHCAEYGQNVQAANEVKILHEPVATADRVPRGRPLDGALNVRYDLRRRDRRPKILTRMPWEYDHSRYVAALEALPR